MLFTDLPPDGQMAIFARIPLQFRLQCRLVSRTWYEHISAQLRREHQLRIFDSPANAASHYHYTRHQTFTTKPSFTFDPWNTLILNIPKQIPESIRGNTALVDQPPMHLPTLFPNVTDLLIFDVDNRLDIPALVSSWAPKLTKLHIESDLRGGPQSHPEQQLLALLKEMPNLVQFHFNPGGDVHSDDTSGFDRLEEFSMWLNENRTNVSLLQRLTRNATSNLKRLLLDRFRQFRHSNDLPIELPCSVSQLTMAQDSWEIVQIFNQVESVEMLNITGAMAFRFDDGLEDFTTSLAAFTSLTELKADVTLFIILYHLVEMAKVKAETNNPDANDDDLKTFQIHRPLTNITTLHIVGTPHFTYASVKFYQRFFPVLLQLFSALSRIIWSQSASDWWNNTKELIQQSIQEMAFNQQVQITFTDIVPLCVKMGQFGINSEVLKKTIHPKCRCDCPQCALDFIP